MNSRFDFEVNDILTRLIEAPIDDIVADTEKPSSAWNKIKSGIKSAAKVAGSAAITAATGGLIDPFSAHDYLNKDKTTPDSQSNPTSNPTSNTPTTPTAKTTTPNQSKNSKMSDSQRIVQGFVTNLKQVSPGLNTRDSSIIVDRFAKKLRNVTMSELSQATDNLQILTPPTQIDDRYIDTCFARLSGPNGKQPIDKGGLGPLSDQAAIKSYSDLVKHVLKVAPAMKDPKKMQAFFKQNGLLS